MNIVMVILRLIHVLAGVFWAGATFVMASHISPTVRASGTEGQKFMQNLAGKSNISNALGLTGTLTLLSGLIMYGLQGWETRLNTPAGIVLTLGVVLGTGAFFHGLFVQRKAIKEMQTLGASIAAAGGPPTPDQAARLGTLSEKINRNGIMLAYLLGVTVILMGVFQYV